MNVRRLLLLAAASSSVAWAADPLRPVSAQPATTAPFPAYFKTGVLDFESRVWAQTQIERVYYNHRIWPKENPQPKPPFELMVPAAVIEAKVTDALKKSAALDKFWQHPVTGEMLQAELDRMAKQTHDPAMLRELFAALNNDPRLIAETLARGTLSDRLIRNWYAYDARFHAEARTRAETAAAHAGEADWAMLGEAYQRQRVILDNRKKYEPDATSSRAERHVDAGEFSRLIENFSLSAGLQSKSPEESADEFRLTRAVNISNTSIEYEILTFSKTSFTDWWRSVSRASDLIEYKFKSTDTVNRWVLPAVSNDTGCNEWGFSQNLYGAPDGRSNHTAVWTGTEMVVWGGMFGSGIRMNTGGRYNPSTDSWASTSTSDPVPSPRYSHTAIWTGTVMIISGGNTSDFSFPSLTGGQYNPSSDTWLATSLGANVPFSRSKHTAIWTGAVMIIWGGTHSGTMNSGGRYDPFADTWLPTSTGSNVPLDRVQHTAIWTGTEMVIWGGCNDSGSACYNTGGRYNPLTNSWLGTSVGTNAPSSRREHSAIWTGAEMIVWAGCISNGSPVNTGGRYNPSTDTWISTSTGTNVPNATKDHSAIWSGTEMIVWGGSGNAGGRYDPGSDTWASTSTGSNTPAPRTLHTVVWTGTEMIIWGGTTALFRGDNTGGRYNPASNSWLPTGNGASTPDRRASHTAVWTGVEMIVWGGIGGLTYYNTGGRYNPALDSWQITSIAAATPSPRIGHTAVWTGNEMLIWGGYRYLIQANNYKDGSRYNPVTDTWMPTSTGINVPAARSNHTAVWNGNKMIVWGGASYVSGTVLFNSGGLYDPASDSWLSTSTGTNVPSARYLHSAVWTGSTMIIWGGNGATGGRYNPTTDTWLPTSTGADVPAGRYNHSAVWTGDEMIIWGGQSSGTYFPAGGRYMPVTDSWLPTSTGLNSPYGRIYHSAVWNGLEMLIWGGYSASLPDPYINTGGHYNPYLDSWLPITASDDSPAARQQHTAVWTGTHMIVWGGSLDEPYNSGGLFHTARPDSPGVSLRGVKSANIDLYWMTISNADTYNVMRCDPAAASCFPGTIVSTPSVNQYSETDDGISHFYAIEAINACGATP